MLSFDQFLTEGRDAPLYHGSDFDNLASIVKNKAISGYTSHIASELGNMKTKEHDVNGVSIVSGISATRSLRFAMKWKQEAVLVLNQSAIAQRYKLVPINYWSSATGKARKHEKLGSKIQITRNFWQNEFEEFIVSAKEVPTKFVTKIILGQTKFDHMSDQDQHDLLDAIEQSKIPYELRVFPF